MHPMHIRIIILLAAGLVPYYIARRRLPDGTRHIEVRAIFWTYTSRQPPRGPRSWTLHIILIDRLRSVVWAVIDQLRRSA